MVSSSPSATVAELDQLRAIVATRRSDPEPRPLASALNDLAGCLFADNQVDEAMATCEEAVALASAALEGGDEAARYVVVSAMINRAGGSLRRSDARTAADGLAAAALVFAEGGETGIPFLGPMIEALHRAALAFSEIGLWDEAIRMRRLTLGLFVASPPPPAAVQILALTLIQAANADSARADHGAAQVLAEEGVTLARGLAQSAAGEYRTLLAQALGTLARCCHHLGAESEGLDAALEAVNLLQSLVAEDPLAAVPSLVLTLESLAAILAAMGMGEQAAMVGGQLSILRASMDRLSPEGAG